MKESYKTISSLVYKKPGDPLFAFRPHVLKRASRFFLDHFPGKALYAVKTNPEPHILKSLFNQGVKSFDVASLKEIALVKNTVPEAECYFMHPVKSRESIRKAYFSYKVRSFSLDSHEELTKIMEETKYAKDLTLFVRISMPNTYAELNLAEKFGINLQEAPLLMRETKKYAAHLGVCFHVGSQCMHPDAYRIAIRMTANVLQESAIEVKYFNVGGGFPSIYPGMIPRPMHEYFDAIKEEFLLINKKKKMELLCEPGRALVAESTSLIVRVDLRKGTNLYINDGTYGSLFDAGTPHFIFPVRLIRNKAKKAPVSADLQPFSFYGPTCDTLDFMKGPFYLPNDTKEGDYIEIGQIGSYGRTLATGFNGFGHRKGIRIVRDEPLMTMYDMYKVSTDPLEVIAA